MRRVSAEFFGASAGDIRRVGGYLDAGKNGRRLLSLTISEQSSMQVASASPAAAFVISSHLQDGDVVACDPTRGRAEVLFRAGDRHHALFVTNRCNSKCLMCSQPPTPQDDSWLVQQALEVVARIDSAPLSIGITGGEPTLLGDDLARLAQSIRELHPTTGIEVLTNGRVLGDSDFADPLLMKMPSGVSWLVPLYGHADFLHDYVVQAPGAFDETIGGLLNLRRHEQTIQVRIVLVRPVLENLVQICDFIGRNLPFVHDVALMVCEPIGFALANEEQCRVTLTEWHDVLLRAAASLRRRRMRFAFMNAPLCALPEGLRTAARRSISDWKNVYAEDCQRCSAKAECCGLFAWHETAWTPAPIRPIMGEGS